MAQFPAALNGKQLCTCDKVIKDFFALVGRVARGREWLERLKRSGGWMRRRFKIKSSY